MQPPEYQADTPPIFDICNWPIYNILAQYGDVTIGMFGI